MSSILPKKCSSLDNTIRPYRLKIWRVTTASVRESKKPMTQKIWDHVWDPSLLFDRFVPNGLVVAAPFDENWRKDELTSFSFLTSGKNVAVGRLRKLLRNQLIRIPQYPRGEYKVDTDDCKALVGYVLSNWQDVNSPANWNPVTHAHLIKARTGTEQCGMPGCRICSAFTANIHQAYLHQYMNRLQNLEKVANFSEFLGKIARWTL